MTVGVHHFMLFRLLLAVILGLPAAPAAALESRIPEWVEPALIRICEAFRAASPPDERQVAALLGRKLAPGRVERDGDRILRMRFAAEDDAEITVVASLPGTTNMRVSLVESHLSDDAPNMPIFSMAAASDCRPIHAEELALDPDTKVPNRIIRYSGQQLEREAVEPLNPPMPEGRNYSGVRVAQIDTGVAYTLPDIANRLARDGRGNMVGYDYADYDVRPFDREADKPLLFARPHGTGVAATLLREAPEAALIPIRASAADAKVLGRLPDEAVRRGGKIVLMSLGELRMAIWPALVEAARDAPQSLFVVSAGDEGRNLDLLHSPDSVPANLLIVTSVEADGTLSPEANWGPGMVDLAIPAERLATVSSLGAPALGSGADYAAARAAALAARIVAMDPDKRNGTQLKSAVLKRAKILPDTKSPPVRMGWIEDPTKDD